MSHHAAPEPSASQAIDDLADLDSLLTDDERAWQSRARAFAHERILPTIEGDFEDKHFRAEFIPELGAAGFLGMHLTGHGAAGAGAVSYGLACLELEAADSGWRTFVSVQGSLAMSAIARFGSEEQKAEWLPRMASGEVVGCFALTEPDGGSDPASMGTRAVRDGDDWILTGSKHRRGRDRVGADRGRRARLHRADRPCGLLGDADRREALDARVHPVRCRPGRCPRP
jgi:glutaryl-CoA dehydrogenase